MDKNKAQKGNDLAIEDQPQETEQPIKKSSSPVATAFIFLAVILALASGGVCFLLFQQLQQQRTEQAQQLENTRNALSQVTVKVNGEMSSQMSAMNQALQRMSTDQQQFQAQVSHQQQTTEALSRKMELSNQQMLSSIEVLYKQKGRERLGWVLAEVEYLLLIANHSLQLQKNVQTAITALEAADSRLLDTGDPGTIDVRTQIREEVQQLKALRRPDTVGMAARLTSLIKRIPQLPIKYSQVNSKEKITALVEKKASHDAGNLEQASKDFLQELRGLIVFRQLDERPKALMTPQEQFFLQQNLQLKLETARSALLAEQQLLFSEGVQEAQQWLQEFFDLEVALVNQMLSELKTLQRMNIMTDLPNISGSIKLLRSYQKVIEKQQEVKQ